MRVCAFALCLALAAIACLVIASPRDEPAPAAQAAQALPPPVRLARADAAKRRNVSAGRVRVIRVMPKTWPDGCLGLAKPGQMCSQALVKGYRATFSARGKRLSYRTDRKTRFVLEPR